GLDPYDALLDGFEPGATSASVERLFAELGAFLPGFIPAVLEKQAAEPLRVPKGPFPIERQKWLGAALMQRSGFDFKRGRLDVTHHPFCGGVPEDVRVTTRYDETSFVSALMGVMHETGHAKYEQNLPRDWLSQPVGRARGMGMHESQSLLLEMQVCRGRHFLEFARPFIAEAFPQAFAVEPTAFTTDNLYRLYTRVKPDFIRVDADEVTYPCHVILRFEIERPLVLGQLRVSDIPELWNERMQKLLGISTAGEHRNGCMQDVHWPAGLFGYFPSYTLGALAAAQLFQAAVRDQPTLLDGIAAGEFTPLDTWLRERVWSVGSSLDTNALLIRATGAPLGTAPFITHLRRRYLEE
ncbi:MAG TPA: carboxypeptidase M32, partial [Polyangiaceae bacterium]